MFDVLTTAAMADELATLLVDGRIQRIGLRDRQTLVAEVYARRQRHYLVAAIGGREAILYRTTQEPPIDTSLVTPFSLLLRKYLRGGVIVAVDQPPLDRIIRLSIAKRMLTHNQPEPEIDDREPDDDDAEGLLGQDYVPLVYSHLSIELMGRRSNVILVDDQGLVMDSLKRVTPEMSRVRSILPKRPFVLPPPVQLPDPRTVTEQTLTNVLQEAPPDAEIAALLVRGLAGVSPQAAREIVFRATGQADRTVASLSDEQRGALAGAIRQLYGQLESGAWAPTVYRDEEGAVRAYSSVPMQHLQAIYSSESVDSMSEAIVARLDADGAEESPTRHAGRRDKLFRDVKEAEERLAVKRANLEQQAEAVKRGDRYRTWGELIYSHLWEIEPGQQELQVNGETIPLDPQKSPSETAQEYFEAYRRAARGADQIPTELEAVEREIAYLRQLLTHVEQATRFDDIEALNAEWESYRTKDRPESSRPKRSLRKRHTERPSSVTDRFGNQIHIGRSGPQNEFVTFEVAQPDDFWLHARGVPGAHVILRPARGADEVTDDALLAAASIAAYYSASRSSGRVEVDFCRRRHVKKIKGAGPGMVTYRNERTIAVTPRDEREALARQMSER